MKLTEFESNLKNKIVTLHNKINLISDRLLGPEPRCDKGDKSKSLYSHRDIMLDSIEELKKCYEDLRSSFLAFCFDIPTNEESISEEKPPIVNLAYGACDVLFSIRHDLREIYARLGVEPKEEKEKPTANISEPTTYKDACINILCVLEDCIEICYDILEYIGNDERPTIAGGVSK